MNTLSKVLRIACAAVLAVGLGVVGAVASEAAAKSVPFKRCDIGMGWVSASQATTCQFAEAMTYGWVDYGNSFKALSLTTNKWYVVRCTSKRVRQGVTDVVCRSGVKNSAVITFRYNLI